MKKRQLILGLLMLASANHFGQSSQLKKANNFFSNYSYSKAIPIYEGILNEGVENTDIYKNLADAYYYNNDLSKAAKNYTKLFANNTDLSANYYSRFSQSLKAIGEYDKADAIMIELHKRTALDKRGALYTTHKNYRDVIAKNSGRFTIKNLAINSVATDFSPAFYHNQLVFSSSRKASIIPKRLHAWNNKSFLDLYVANVEGKIVKAKRFSKALTTILHESSTTFSNDGKTIYFTRNTSQKGDEKGIIRHQIYKATLEGEKWGNITSLPFNNVAYSVAHPSLSPDGNYLYFSSDMPGSVGASDIYRVSINGDSYGTPENIKAVNTEGRDTFPFITKEGNLYFSSDGHQGLGGLDVFYYNLNGDNTEVYNVGEPVNSNLDDFSFIINTTTNKGYFSSDREGGKGEDDIYSFTRTSKLNMECIVSSNLSGILRDVKTGEIIANGNVTLFVSGKSVSTTTSDSSGAFSFTTKVACKDSAEIKGTKEGYSLASYNVPAEAMQQNTIDLRLEKEDKGALVGSDLAKILNLPKAYFDTNKFNVRADARVGLEKLITYMTTYNDVIIAIKTHTDSRGRNSYNQKLSDKRATSILEYLVKQGISRDRLTAKGYGETQLTNDCSNNVTCSKDEHQANRRSEFFIVKN